MKKNLFVRRAIAAACFAAFAASGSALAADEAESNNTIATAQALQFDSGGVAVVNAFMGDGDADLFSFQAKANDVVTVDIDGGAKNGGPGHIDTFVTVLLPESDGSLVMRGDDDAPLDEGSVGPEDTYLADVAIPKDGVYYVGVAGFPNRVVDGGALAGGPGNLTGTYTLIVTIVRPVSNDPGPQTDPDPQTEPDPQTDPNQSQIPEQPVEVVTIGIDIKPGVRRVAKVDPNSRREIPVALLGSRDFDVRKVDVSSLTFGSTGDEQSLKRCSRHPVRVNRDRRPDLICFFENQDAGFQPSDEEGVLKGKTVDDKPFIGRSMLKVIAEKRKNRHESRRHDRDDDDGDDRRRRRNRRDD